MQTRDLKKNILSFIDFKTMCLQKGISLVSIFSEGTVCVFLCVTQDRHRSADIKAFFMSFIGCSFVHFNYYYAVASGEVFVIHSIHLPPPAFVASEEAQACFGGAAVLTFCI